MILLLPKLRVSIKLNDCFVNRKRETRPVISPQIIMAALLEISAKFINEMLALNS